MPGTRSRAPRIVLSMLLMLAAQTPAPAQAAASGPPLPSSFPGPLWDVITPAGGTVSVANAHLTLHVPGGSNHDAVIPSNQTVRVIQPIGNQNFDVSIKVDTPVIPADVGTSRGLMVVAGDQDFITYELATDGTNISLNAKQIAGGSATTVFNLASFNEPVPLRGP